MATYPSFGEQSAHYFNRPHDEIPSGPVATVAAWRGDAIADDDTWRFTLSSAQIEEIEAAIRSAIATGRPTGELERKDFPLPDLSPAIAGWREELDTGRGFVVITGLPVDRWPDMHSEVFFWCFGLHLGRPGGQNPAGDLLGHVRDTGNREHDEFVRLYQTTANIAYHCDAADVVGLLCKNNARSGGSSRIVSSVSVYNELVETRPDLARRLYEPMLLDVRDAKPGAALRYFPVPPCRYASGRLRTFYHSDYFRSVQRHDDARRHTDLERELLDLYEEIANTPGLYLDMDLEPGDIQLVSNHTVLHARTEYREWPEPERKRHLLRLWLSLDR
ncbi:MAG: TauD/TfdA family dioxygenase [Deltaproteobacteria bacterium]|nr:TauD/TfdA family dioxygenase [Deltaproteobacteria bacterium]MBW2390349.1 TauD/TfdA family dioxygenase [Deltaproteobacteria bacterium]MBW2724132.1 TauD/TfdA family dioxygenase [Deltaproteobacteria bacterium]